MNKELLTKLSNEAYTYAVNLYERMEDNPACDEAYEEKLAELIVRECILVSKLNADMLEKTMPNEAYAIYSNNVSLRRHFGVKE
jgi:hypothetical protein